MPRLIDYGARFDLMREAVARIAAEGGASAVTLAAVAEELHLSVHTLRRTISSPSVLPQLGVEHVVNHRRNRNLLTPGLRNKTIPVMQRITNALLLELPLDAERLIECRAWAVLTTTSDLPAVVRHRNEHQSYLRALAGRAVEHLPEAARRCEQLRLVALVDGLTAGECTDRLDAEEVTGVLGLHLTELAARPSEDVA